MLKSDIGIGDGIYSSLKRECDPSKLNQPHIKSDKQWKKQLRILLYFISACWNEEECTPIISGKRNLILFPDRMEFSSLSNDL